MRIVLSRVVFDLKNSFSKNIVVNIYGRRRVHCIIKKIRAHETSVSKRRRCSKSLSARKARLECRLKGGTRKSATLVPNSKRHCRSHDDKHT